MRVLGGDGGVGPWVLHLTCCGFDDGSWRQPTWEEADALREAYVAAEGHDRSAVLTFDEAPYSGREGTL